MTTNRSVAPGNRPLDDVQRLLWCAGCARRLRPLRTLGEPTAYDCGSGCRARPLLATAVERQVHRAAERYMPAPLTRLARHGGSPGHPQGIVKVVVGATPDDLTITWRI